MAVCWLLGAISRISSVWPYGFRDASGFFSASIPLRNLVFACVGLVILYIAMYYSRTATLDVRYNFWWVIGSGLLILIYPIPQANAWIARMRSAAHNYLNRAVYDQYALKMRLWGSENVRLPWNPAGAHPVMTAELVRDRRYPAWVKKSGLASCIFGFALYPWQWPLSAEARP